MTALAAPRRRPPTPGTYVEPPPGPVGVVACVRCGCAVLDAPTARAKHDDHHGRVDRLGEWIAHLQTTVET